MRVLLLNWQDRLNPQAGGAEIHLHEVFGRLAARGHEVTLLASGWRGAAPREWVDGLDVRRAGARYTFSLAAPRHYRARLAGGRFDLVVEALNKVPVYAPLWSRAPVALVVHHLFGATAFREASLPLAGATWLLERPLGAVYRGVPAQVISRSTADDLVARGLRPADLEVVYPGVDLEFFHPSPDVPRAGVPTFLYLGRLKRYKGIGYLLDAVDRLRREGTVVRVRIGGRGEHEPELRRQAERLGLEGQVEFLGFVSEAEKRDLFRSAWANVFPSPKEGWGITNLEAAACGTPTIASDAPGLRESVLHGQTGLLVPHGDVAALADALRSLAGAPARVEELGRAALRFAASFTWDRTAEQTARHLARVLETSRAAARAPDPSP